MSSPTLPPLRRPSGQPDAAPTLPGVDAFIADPAAEGAIGAPPSALIEKVAAAAGRDDRLRRSGRRLRFSHPASGHTVRVELLARDGSTLRTLSAGEAIEIAAGKWPS